MWPGSHVTLSETMAYFEHASIGTPEEDIMAALLLVRRFALVLAKPCLV